MNSILRNTKPRPYHSAARERTEFWGNVAGYIIGTILFVLAIKWYWYLWWQSIPYLLALCLAGVFQLATCKLVWKPIAVLFRFIMAAIFLGSCILQLLIWFGILEPGVFAR